MWRIALSLWLLTVLFVGCIATVPQGTRILLFALEESWSPGKVLGSSPYCTTGGVNHAKRVLSSFLSVASIFEATRRPVLLRPTYIFSDVHGATSPLLTWDQLFDWDVDSAEFVAPDDVWSAYRRNPARFEVFDVFDSPVELIPRILQSQAEVAVLHMYERSLKFGAPSTSHSTLI